MARRPWHCYSKHRSKWVFQKKRSAKKDLIRGGADSRVRMYDVGNMKSPKDRWDMILGLESQDRVQISDHALEAVRTSINRRLQKRMGRENFHLRIRVKPFHIYRENKMMAFAGADRLQTGMRQSFGKPAGRCARVEGGQIVLELRSFLRFLPHCKKALDVANKKLPCSNRLVLLDCKDEDMEPKIGLPEPTEA